jgi:hypothetical protein
VGHEIVYCSECQVRISGADFEKGRAFRIRDQCLCADCAKAALDALPPEEREKVLARRATPASGTRLPAVGAPVRPGSTSRMPRAAPSRPVRKVEPVEEPPEEEAGEPPSPKRKIALLGGAGGVLLLVIVLVVALSGKKRGPSDDGRKPGPGEPADALRKARDFCNANPTDFDGQVGAWQEAVRQAQGTPRFEEARKELAALTGRQKDVLENQGLAFENQLKGPLDLEEFKTALDICEQSAPLFRARAWIERVGLRIKEIRERPAALFPMIREKAALAKGNGDTQELTRLRERVARWGVGTFLAEFDASFAMAPAPAPDPNPAPPAPAPAPAPEPPPAPAPPPAPPLPPAVAAYRARWEKAMRLAALRDFTAAASEVANASRQIDDADLRQEAAADLEAANLLDAVFAETLKLLAKTPPGGKLALSFLDGAGRPRRFEGAAVQARPWRIVLRNAEEETVAVEFGEITGASLAEVFAARPDRKPEKDAGAAALLCLLDGDAEAARKHVPDPGPAAPAKYWDLGGKIAEERQKADPAAAGKEAEARKIFYEAAGDWPVAGKTYEAVQKLTGLLNEFAETAFVRRNRPSIAGRAEAGKEYYFLTQDLVPSGTFKPGKSPKGMEAIIAADDVSGPAGKTNFVDVVFSAFPGQEYRCWVLMGGCCKENFFFFLQATDMTMPDPRNPRQSVQVEPDGNYAQPVKISVANLKPSHQAHGGKKEPTRFEWVPIPLPKYASPGAKVVRLLAESKGSAIARALVSSVRKEAPKEADLGELEKARADELAGSTRGKPPAGKILRECWKGIGGGGVNDLRGHLQKKPSETSLLEVFEGPSSTGNDYGSRVRGYVHPPKTGKYVFWISSDDQSELWLSTDEDPANRQKIAWAQEWTGPREWTKFKEQQSEPVRLEAGRRYYIEALQKQGGGGDHLSVGWQLPDGTQERPIPGSRLSDK